MPIEVSTFALSVLFMSAVALLFILGGLGVVGTVRVQRCSRCTRWSLAPVRPRAQSSTPPCWRCRHQAHTVHLLRGGHVPRIGHLLHLHVPHHHMPS